MKAIVVGSGAGGATAARELQIKGFDVTILEAGPHFKPFTWNLSHIELIKRLGLLKTGITEIFLSPSRITPIITRTYVSKATNHWRMYCAVLWKHC
jgi:choline dehydrogenase-like flavoprotein